MNLLPVLIAFVLLGATSFDACAQTAPTPQPAPTTDDVGHTGTDTVVAPTGEDEVGHTGTDTVTAGTPLPTEEVGHTGTDTRTPSGASPWTLAATSSAISSPGSVSVSVAMPADAAASADASYTVPLSSSAPACTVPASVALDWSPSTGASTSFQVDCAKVSKRTTVTITGGTATTSFTLKP